MTQVRPVALILLGAVALLATGWWLGQRQGPSDHMAAGTIEAHAARQATVSQGAAAPLTPKADASSTPSPGVEPVSAPGPAAPTTMAVASLPPPGTRLADVYDELLERARRGDARAACRLAADLGRCRNAPTMSRGGGGGGGGRRGARAPERMAERIAGIPDEGRRDAMIEMVAQAETWREQAEQVCDGLTHDQLAQAYPLQLQAATAMPELRVPAALSPALDRAMPGNDAEQWQQYRQIAQTWLEQAAAEGDLTAIVALARVHGEGRRPSPPWPPYRALDDARLVTYASLLARYGVSIGFVTELEEAARARLDPAALRQAEDRAQSLYRADRVPDTAAREGVVARTMPRPFEAPRCD